MPRPRRSDVRRSRRARARTEARRRARPVAREELVAEHGAIRLPPHRRPARVRGQHRRRAGDPDADLARQGGDGQGGPPAQPLGAGVGHRPRHAERQSVRPGGAGARSAERHRDAPAGTAPQGRGCGQRDGAGIVVAAAGRQAGVRVPGAEGRALGGGQARDVGRDGRGRPRVDRSRPADEGEARAPGSTLRASARDPRRGANARGRHAARVPDAERDDASISASIERCALLAALLKLSPSRRRLLRDHCLDLLSLVLLPLPQPGGQVAPG